MGYNRTKDILYVKRLLGHRRIDNTLVYTQLIDSEPDDSFSCRVAGTLEGAADLIEAASSTSPTWTASSCSGNASKRQEYMY